jgi:hypothetical protein
MIFDITPPIGFNSEREGSNVEEQHVALASSQNVGLDRGSESNHFIGIQIRMWYASEERLNSAADQRNSCRTADHNHFINAARLQALRPAVPGGRTSEFVPRWAQSVCRTRLA